MCDGTVCTWLYAALLLLSVSLYTLIKNIGLCRMVFVVDFSIFREIMGSV
ncbi:hypothetical protein AB71_2927 [Escherichia coli 1-182-04_S1_C3]|nr:hypothetical protein AB71_2927 [Escherichia coli 1-182-04_S1_C3]